MQNVNGFFTGEVLCEKLISEISAIKILKENAADKIVNAVKTYKKSKGGGIESEFRRWHIQLKVVFPVNISHRNILYALRYLALNFNSSEYFVHIISA